MSIGKSSKCRGRFTDSAGASMEVEAVSVIVEAMMSALLGVSDGESVKGRLRRSSFGVSSDTSIVPPCADFALFLDCSSDSTEAVLAVDMYSSSSDGGPSSEPVLKSINRLLDAAIVLTKIVCPCGRKLATRGHRASADKEGEERRTGSLGVDRGGGRAEEQLGGVG